MLLFVPSPKLWYRKCLPPSLLRLLRSVCPLGRINLVSFGRSSVFSTIREIVRSNRHLIINFLYPEVIHNAVIYVKPFQISYSRQQQVQSSDDSSNWQFGIKNYCFVVPPKAWPIKVLFASEIEHLQGRLFLLPGGWCRSQLETHWNHQKTDTYQRRRALRNWHEMANAHTLLPCQQQCQHG